MYEFIWKVKKVGLGIIIIKNYIMLMYKKTPNVVDQLLLTDSFCVLTNQTSHSSLP